MNFLQNILSRFRPTPSGSTALSADQTNWSRSVDLSKSQILFAEGRVLSPGKVHLNRLVVVPLNNEAALTPALKVLFDEKKCPRDNVRLSLKSPQVITRFLRFPKMTEKELRGVLQFEIEQYVPYEAKDLYLDLTVVQEAIKTDQGENSEILVAVSKKEYLDPLLQQYQDVQVDISAVDVDMLACMKCLEFFYPQEFAGHTAILDLGGQVTSLGIVRAGKPRFIRDLSFGTQDIIKKLKNRVGVSDSDLTEFLSGKLKVSELQAASFSESIENLLNDVKVSFDYYRDQSEDAAGVDHLFICGTGSAQDYILAQLQKAIDISVSRMNLSEHLELGQEVSADMVATALPDLPVAVGLLLADRFKINLLPPALRKQKKKKVSAGANAAASSKANLLQKIQWGKVALGAAALFAALTFYGDFDCWRLEKKLAQANGEWKSIQPRMQVLRILEQQVNSELVPERDFLMTNVLSKAPVTSLLQVMSEGLPDGMWLSSFMINNSGKARSFKIQGLAQNLPRKTDIEQIEEYLQKLKTVIPNSQFHYSTSKQAVEKSSVTEYNADYDWQAE